MADGELVWERDGRGRVTRLEGEIVTVRTTKPGAPGSRPVGVLPSGSELRVKVHRCRKIDEADGMTFTIEARLLDATKAQRAELSALAGGPPAET
jgi:hypothetical protein